MQIGALMSALEDEGFASNALEALGDIVLLREVQDMGEAYEETPGEYIAGASRRFANLASDEDWLSLMNALERSPEPGRAALDRMVRWALARDAAENSGTASDGCGGGGCTCGGKSGHDPQSIS